MKDISYTIGYQAATGNKQQALIVVPEAVLEGYETAICGKALKYPDAEMRRLHQEFTKAFEAQQRLNPGKAFEGDTAFVSYVIGLNIASQLMGMGSGPFVGEDFLAGLKDGVAGKSLRFTAQEMAAIEAKFSKALNEKANALIEETKAAGQAFLSENKKKEGVLETKSGLQYEVIKMGQGEKPMATSNVEVHYAGTLLDGTEFDSSYKRGTPAVFPLNQVIKGWTEGLQLMPCGSKFRFYIPSDLAYGDRGAGSDIPGGATLIFDVELISIK